ncbi:hypothetical protein TNCV_2804611 [Trichonephila clavipes]|nr:hypothetical protein TNCV_2804611 [Trichonephila clavipes]
MPAMLRYLDHWATAALDYHQMNMSSLELAFFHLRHVTVVDWYLWSLTRGRRFMASSPGSTEDLPCRGN